MRKPVYVDFFSVVGGPVCSGWLVETSVSPLTGLEFGRVVDFRSEAKDAEAGLWVPFSRIYAP